MLFTIHEALNGEKRSSKCQADQTPPHECIKSSKRQDEFMLFQTPAKIKTSNYVHMYVCITPSLAAEKVSSQ